MVLTRNSLSPSLLDFYHLNKTSKSSPLSSSFYSNVDAHPQPRTAASPACRTTMTGGEAEAGRGEETEEMAGGGGCPVGAAGAGTGVGSEAGGGGMRAKGEGGTGGCGGSSKRDEGTEEEPRRRVWQRSGCGGLQVRMEPPESMPTVLGEEKGCGMHSSKVSVGARWSLSY